MASTDRKIIIVGGGIIGISTGWQLARRGCKVTVIEKGEPGRGATWAAAGMLAPYAEVSFEEEALLALGAASLDQYEAFLEELRQDTTDVPNIYKNGTLVACLDRDDTENLKRLFGFKEKINLNVEMLTGTAAREREPLLSPRVVSAMWLPEDMQIDNRALLQALRHAFEKNGGRLITGTEVTRVDLGGGEKKVYAGGQIHVCTDIVIAAGAYSNELEGIPEQLSIPVRPVKGQIITLKKTDDVELSHMLRSPRVYICPKEDGTLRIGATSEEKGFNTDPTAGGMKDLLDEAWELMPSIYDLPVIEFFAGLRPASPDHYPLIGKTGHPGFYYAAGFYRGGILLTPVTAVSMADIILEDRVSDLLRPFQPLRFNENSAG